MSKQRCQSEVTSSEFVEWKVHMEEGANDFHPLHYYLAQIAFVASQGAGGKKVEDFLIEFVRKKQKPKKKRTREEAVASMQAAFFGMAGTPKGTK